MIRKIRFATTSLCLALTTMLSVGAATSASAAVELDAVAAVATAPAEQTQELAEIQVRGKRLGQAISEAEDSFFKLYNKLNKKYDFDIRCGELRTTASLVPQRACVPNFLAENLEDASYAGMASLNNPGMQSCNPPYGENMIRNYDMNGDAFYTTPACYYSGYATPYYTPPPAALVVMANREQYAANVTRVMRSDPELLRKATTLAKLYQEKSEVEQYYRNLRQGK